MKKFSIFLIIFVAFVFNVCVKVQAVAAPISEIEIDDEHDIENFIDYAKRTRSDEGIKCNIYGAMAYADCVQKVIDDLEGDDYYDTEFVETKGYITRSRSKQDERNLDVCITKKGIELKDKAINVPKSMSSCIKLSPEEAEILYKTLYKILSTLNDEQ